MGLFRLALCSPLALALACGHAPPSAALGPPPALPELRKTSHAAPQPDHFWEPIEPELRGPPRPLGLPVAEGSIMRVEGATRVWDQLGEDGRERVQKDGLVVVDRDVIPPTNQIGVFYMQMREQRVPYVVTLDALSFVLHAAFERALAEVDETIIAPGVRALLAMLEARLGAEQKGAGVEIGEGLRLARGIVAVANVLARDASASVPKDLAAVVTQEIARIDAHSGIEESPLLGGRIDYAAFVAPPEAADPRAFRALTWLANAPLLLSGRSEARGANIEVSTARTHTRAAMLLARAFARDVDPAIHDAWKRLARLFAFLWGPPDDLAPPELGEIAASADVRLLDPRHISDVTKIDRLRRRAAKGRLPRVFDGSGAPGLAGLSVRVFGGHAPADSVALASLARVNGTIPSVLDVAAFLGAAEARAAARENGIERTAAYEAALTQVIAARPPFDAPSRHASVYGSLLDVVMTWMAGDADARRVIDSPAARRATIDSALSAWTFARHDGLPLTRGRAPGGGAGLALLTEINVGGAPLPAFIEAAPDVIARLVAAAAQMRRGLVALGALPPTSPSLTILAEVEDILRIALRIATASSNDEATSSEDATALAALPARLARLDGSVTVTTSADVLVDRGRAKVLVSATSVVEPAVMVVAEPGTGKNVLAVGAHVAHHEIVNDLSRVEPVDRDRPAPPRGAYTAAFRMVR